MADSGLSDPPAGSAGLNPRDAVRYEVVAFCCIAETLNAQLLVTILQRASAPRIAGVVRRLLKDEAAHSKLGWAHLAAERRLGFGAFLGAILPSLLNGAVDPGLFRDGPDPVD